jgi:hypothetical protein
MVKSCRQQIVEAAFAIVQTIPAQETAGGAYSDVKFFLNRRTPLVSDDDAGAPADVPAAILFEGGETPLNDFSSLDLYELTLVLQLAAKGAGEEAVAWVNNLRADAIKVLKADLTLGGLVRWLEITDPGDFIGAETAAETEGALLAFTVHYATKEGDPFTFE